MRDRQELSLMAAPLTDVASGLIDRGMASGATILPAVVIYGGNASGKSNVIDALSYMRSAVLYSHSRGEPGSAVFRKPFALDPNCAAEKSTFEIDFLIEGVRYSYGFEIDGVAFISEWLNSFPNGRRLNLFERKNKDFTFGRSLKGRNKIISDLTRSNSLFVSAGAQNDHEELSIISGYFRSIQKDSDLSSSNNAVSRLLTDEDFDRRAIDFLRRMGTGVIDYRLHEKKMPEQTQKMLKEIMSIFDKISSNSTGSMKDTIGETDVVLQLAHQGHDGSSVYFDMEQESSGTRRLLSLLSKLFRTLDAGTVLIVDELDASLHTQACEAVIALFSSHETNPKGGQLISTTHDTNLLHSSFLRRDQIWFTEKDKGGATHLYPLTDIRTRKGDNIEKGYLQGRYGAIPFSGSIANLLAEQ